MRGLFDKIKDTIFYYINDANCRGCQISYTQVNGYVKNGTLYSTEMLYNPYKLTRPLMYEDDFENINETDYKQIGADYIAVYEQIGNDYKIVSYRKFDGTYYPTAKTYKKLFIVNSLF
jgi:hypothetical protein